MLGQSFSRKTRKRGRGRIWELSACKADQVAWDSIFLQTTQKKVLRHNFSEYVFVAAKFPKMRSEDKRPLKRSHFLWRWLMLGVVVMHIYSPPQVTAQNFMPICHSCQAVWILQYTSDDELGAMDLIWYVVFVQVKQTWWVSKRGYIQFMT